VISKEIKFLDCTLRDGGYYNSWDFSKGLVTDYLRAVAESGVDIIEIGLRSKKSGSFKGMFAFCPEDHLATLNLPDHVKVGVMVNASEMLSGFQLDGVLELLFPLPADESRVSLVRIACHLHEVGDALKAVSWLKRKGYLVGINLMQIAGQARSTVVGLAKSVSAYPVDVLYFADSLGSMNPDEVAVLIEWIREGWEGEIGIHTHDNMGMALQNSLRAIDEGATWVDATVTGMGRGPGNAKTEELAIEVADRKCKLVSLVPLMHLVREYFRPMQQAYGWGTNPFYYLAGKYGIHPTYIQQMLSDSRYDEADVLAVIEYLKKVGGNKFSSDALDAARKFYQDPAIGEWRPEAALAGKEILIIGAGPGASKHSDALEAYIRKRKPVVLALNTQSTICNSLIDFRVACHPVRLLADAAKYGELGQKVIAPYSMLPLEVQAPIDKNRILDFGLAINAEKFEFNETTCVTPSSLVVAYALAIASSGKATCVLMAGFDGYGADDPRSGEMEEILAKYQNKEEACPLLAVTPTRYKMPLTSIYLL
jgi:4-hydroxy 2-oxovalerate aldolase